MIRKELGLDVDDKAAVIKKYEGMLYTPSSCPLPSSLLLCSPLSLSFPLSLTSQLRTQYHY